MTANSHNQFRRSHAPRSSLPGNRSTRPAALGAASTRPPSGPVHFGNTLGTGPSSTQNTAATAGLAAATIDESNWFGTHDQAVAEENAGRSMAALVGRIIGAKPFPISARRLADLTRLDVVRIEPVIQVLESDPGLSARLLRLVNSAGYALRQRCTSVRHAATLVGTDRLHQIATTAAVLDLFDSKGPVAAQIIEHSTVVGAFCRYLGAHLALPVDDLFTAGFLHDIGKLMLMETEGDQYVELLTQCASQPDSIHILERQLYGFDHAALAAHVLSAWNIPDPVPKIVAWHHEPALALKTSSLMASLVQTIRLSDAIVYAMRQPEHSGPKEVAQHEAAGYLEISEPQLAAMWGELRILFDECHQQCLGEHAPALDPRSLRPRQPLASSHEGTPSERAHELPKQFPCVECGCPTFGNTCPACNGYVCPDHQVGSNAWCTICARDYRTEKESIPVPVRAKWALCALGAAIVLSGAIGMVSSGSAGALRAGFGTLMLGLLAGLLYVIARIWLVRTRFVRSRPNRFIAEPQLNDGGTQSLVPSMNPETDEAGSAPGSVNWLKANIHLVEPLKEITIREISGVQSDEPAMPPPPNAAAAERRSEQQLTDQPQSEPHPTSVDPVRVQLQRESLVTLPAPAHEEPSSIAESNSDEHSEAGKRRSPRDTLNEHDMAEQLAAPTDQWSETALGTRMEIDTELACASAHKTGPEPEPQFARPLVTFRDASSAALRDSAATHWENRSEDQQAGLAPTAPNGLLDNTTDDSAQASEIVVVAQAVLANDRESDQAASLIPSQCSPNTQPQSDARPPNNNAERHPQATAASVHPLAALGLCSRPPHAPTENSAPVPVTQDTPDNLSAKKSDSTAPDTQHSGSAVAAPPNIESREARLEATNDPTQQDVLKNLAEDLASRFGADFEAQVRELAAQRVAQMIAERFMAAFDVNSLLKEAPRAQRTQASENPEQGNVAKPKRKRRQA